MRNSTSDTEHGSLTSDQLQRQASMSVLARATAEELAAFLDDLGEQSTCEILRGPETGLVMIRGKIGGGGSAFNLGEATITRATVRLPNGEVGHAYSLGRDKEQVRLAAILDALWQVAANRKSIEEKVLQPLRQRIGRDDQQLRSEVAATKVDFFTMVRGDN